MSPCTCSGGGRRVSVRAVGHVVSSPVSLLVPRLRLCADKGTVSLPLDRQTQATTLVHQIFGGYLRSRVKCSVCKSVSDTYDPYLDVALEIRQAANIVRALELFVKPDVLSGENAYMCAKCKKKVPASKRFTIHRASNVLTLSLKRFANFSGGKITKDVGYPEFLNIRPYMSQSNGEPVTYGLYAVLVHSGYSCHAGHYYCYVKVSGCAPTLAAGALVARLLLLEQVCGARWCRCFSVERRDAFRTCLSGAVCPWAWDEMLEGGCSQCPALRTLEKSWEGRADQTCQNSLRKGKLASL
ncbi:hypothetical protein CB1_000299003 [Camelus ferus]|nr:hypothetical protein CB1_000299003 [Camelus ferus]